MIGFTRFLELFASSHCPMQSKYGLPVWYKYLEQEEKGPKECVISESFNINNFDFLARIGLAAIEIILRVGAMVAVAYVVYGGFQYLTSQGAPDQTKSAKDTILNATIGIIIALFATAIVRFVGRSVTGIQ